MPILLFLFIIIFWSTYIYIYFYFFIFQVQKKRRIVGRVQCRNIKSECPPVTCDEPILLPGKCCKTCPNEAQGMYMLLILYNIFKIAIRNP